MPDIDRMIFRAGLAASGALALLGAGTAVAGWDEVASHVFFHVGGALSVLLVATVIAGLMVRRSGNLGGMVLVVVLSLVAIVAGQVMEAVGALGYDNSGVGRFAVLVFTHNVIAGISSAAGALGLVVALPLLALRSLGASRSLRWGMTALAGLLALTLLTVLTGLDPFPG